MIGLTAMPSTPSAELMSHRASRIDRRNALMIALAATHAVVLFTIPTAQVIALGLWWNSNTISHNFIHRPFFRRRDRKSTRLNSSHVAISYAVFCLKKKNADDSAHHSI